MVITTKTLAEKDFLQAFPHNETNQIDIDVKGRRFYLIIHIFIPRRHTHTKVLNRYFSGAGSVKCVNN